MQEYILIYDKQKGLLNDLLTQIERMWKNCESKTQEKNQEDF